MILLQCILLAVQGQSLDAEEILKRSQEAMKPPVSYTTVTGNIRTRYLISGGANIADRRVRVERKEGDVEVTVISQSDEQMFELFEQQSLAIEMVFARDLVKHMRTPTHLSSRAFAKPQSKEVSLVDVIEADGRRLYVIDQISPQLDERVRFEPHRQVGYRVWISADSYLPVRFGFKDAAGNVELLTEYQDIDPGCELPESLFTVPPDFQLVRATTAEQYTELKRQVHLAVEGSDVLVPDKPFAGEQMLERSRVRSEEMLADFKRESDAMREQALNRTRSSRGSPGPPPRRSSKAKLLLMLNGLLFLCLGVVLAVRRLLRWHRGLSRQVS